MVALNIKELPVLWMFNDLEQNEAEWGQDNAEQGINPYPLPPNSGRQCILSL